MPFMLKKECASQFLATLKDFAGNILLMIYLRRTNLMHTLHPFFNQTLILGAK